MNRQGKTALVVFFSLLMMATLACAVGGMDLPEVNIPEGAAATAGAAARGAATAAAEAGIQETVAAAAGTVVSGVGELGSDAVATLQATDFTTEVEVDADAIRDKVESIEPDTTGTITVVITEQELNQTVRANPDGNEGALIQDLPFQFTGGNIVLRGAVSRPMPTDLVASFGAAVVDGELELAVQQATVAGLPMPDLALAPLESALNNELQRALDRLPENYRVTSVTVGEGSMTIIATPAS